LTGVFAAIPDPFRSAVDYLEPLQRMENPAPQEGNRGGITQRQDSEGQRGQRGQRPRRGRRPQFKPRVGDSILRSAYALHFGNFAGTKVKVAWVILGLAPALLFVTGLLMWITRKIKFQR